MQDSEPTDAALLHQWARHHRESAFHAIVARHLRLVHQAARRVCRDDAMAEEAAQLTFITLARRARSLTTRPSLAGWLHVTAVMHTRNLLRRHRRESLKHERLREQMSFESQEESTAWARLQPHLDAALARLSESDREALLLRFYRSLSVREVASTLGIATAAAQKRLDRATARLRNHLVRDGCSPGIPLGAVMSAGFKADTRAAMPSLSTISGKAVAAAGASSAFPLTSLTLVAMTKKTALAAAILLLAGAGTAIYIASKEKDLPGRTTVEPERPASIARNPTTRGFADTGSPRRQERERDDDAHLIAKYGESRTKLSRHVAGNFIAFHEDIVAVMRMAESLAVSKPEIGGEIRKSMLQSSLASAGLDLEKLQLSKEQQAAALEIYGRSHQRTLEELEEAVKVLDTRRDSLSSFFLAADACKRNEIPEEEYEDLARSMDRELGGMLSRMGFTGEDEHTFLDDELFKRDFLDILESDQAAIFRETADQRAAAILERRSNPAGSAVQLEKRDETLSQARQVFHGIKQILEASGATDGR